MDKCGCCQVCGRTEHELCDLSPEEGRYGICGDNLVCRRKIEVRTRFYKKRFPIKRCGFFGLRREGGMHCVLKWGFTWTYSGESRCIIELFVSVLERI